MSTERRISAGDAGGCIDCGGSAATVSTLFREPGQRAESRDHLSAMTFRDGDVGDVVGVELPGLGRSARRMESADRERGDFEGVVLPAAGRAARPAGFLELSPWTTLEGLNNQYIIQPYRDWGECATFNDVYVVIHVAQVSQADIHIQTSLVDDNEYFQDMVQYGFASGVGVFTTIVRKTAASVPLQNFVRWRIGGTTTNWKATFRVLLLFKT